MPTVTTIPKPTSSDLSSWTAAVNVCKDSGVGISSNCLYKVDGTSPAEHPFEDQYIRLHPNEFMRLYGIFDGHNGDKQARAALDQMCAEILMSENPEKPLTDDSMKTVLRQAFVACENNYMRDIDGLLAQKTALNAEIEGLTSYEAYQKYPHIIDKLNNINTELSCGTTAVIAVINRQRLFVANVGDSRALLCKTDADGVLRVSQLSQDHVISNEDEMLRLSNIGIPLEKLRSGLRLGCYELTRCLGHYLVKGGHKEIENLALATSEPVTAVPDITGPIVLDSSHRFLMLMSSGLYKALEEATGIQSVNQEIARLVIEEFRLQPTLSRVAEAVVDHIGRVHRDFYLSRSHDQNIPFRKEDITLLIRNFNYPMPNVAQVDNTNTPTSHSNSTESTHSVPELSCNRLENGKIKPYVDFSEFYKSVEETPDGLSVLQRIYDSF